jgi:hypothetical protein
MRANLEPVADPLDNLDAGDLPVATDWRRGKPSTVWAAVRHHVRPWLAAQPGDEPTG